VLAELHHPLRADRGGHLKEKVEGHFD
jgi:hypothetical protein